MKNKNENFWLPAIIILNIIFFGSLIIARADSPSPKLSQTAPMKNVVIDGIINATEWEDKDWTISFFLDIDDVGNPPDKDGTNYVFLGEDLDSLYIALDLCSDQTNSTTNEWISLWLNIANRSFDNYENWARYLSNGTESFIYDLENDKIWQFFDYAILYNKPEFFYDNNTEYNAIHGNIEGDLDLLDPVIDPYFNISSEKIGLDHIVQVDFSIDILKLFPVLPGIFSSNVERVRFEMVSGPNTTITENKIIAWYNNGTWDKNDSDQVNDININPPPSWQFFWWEKGNITADRKLNFTLYANHSSPFKVQFDYFTFTVAHNAIRTPHSSVSYPFSSMFDLDMAWGFNSSANNAANHRMFEWRIPKSSLEHFDSDNDIGIMLGGYGTLSFPNTSYWVYSKTTDEITEEFSADYFYFNMLGIDFPINGDGSGATIAGFQILLIIGIAGLYSVILIKKKLKTS